jgi:flagellar hook-associated protein 3 FlgL
MRVSTNQIFQSGLSAMQSAQSKFNNTGMQLATGRRILTAADDPSGATQSVQFKAAIKNTEQYQRNTDYAKPKLEYEEAQLDALSNAMQRARELVVAGNNDTYNLENRKIMASEIRQLRQEIIGLANSEDANGEYLFAGTRSQQQPFIVDEDGGVTYVGAEGPGSVREVDITSNRRIATGHTGADVFMNIPERSGLRTEAVFEPNSSPAVAAGVKLNTDVADLQQSLNSAGQTFSISFEDDGGTLMYTVLNSDDKAIITEPYDPNQPIEFAGRRITLTAPAVDGDKIISRPITHISIFETLDDIAKAFESPTLSEAGREKLSQATSMALRNIDSGLERTNKVRTDVGLRLSVIDTQTELNDERLVDLNSALSEVQDLDYAEAVSRFQFQQTVLQAARQTYTQVNRLSLFDFL